MTDTEIQTTLENLKLHNPALAQLLSEFHARIKNIWMLNLRAQVARTKVNGDTTYQLLVILSPTGGSPQRAYHLGKLTPTAYEVCPLPENQSEAEREFDKLTQ